MTNESDEAPETDLSGVDEVWLGDQSVPGEQFVEMLGLVTEFQSQLDEVRAELANLDTGLDREDTIRLLYGRPNGLKLQQVEATFDVMDAIIDEEPGDIAPRLLADQTSELTIAEAAKVWADMVDLAGKYGQLNAQTDDDSDQ